ncbi:hypothetical protein HDF16_002135 [Granulicella aggregans]|uniref:Uncharacterized protein n=1 Tax=Granulicella aggregans TaxID=474949 RepID=A0A7W7ZCJ6_9BACT|nr:hypothetical protein [Granulicella aggregans]MBB5057429.1 hypothetical protein [Granulicella aggregans]
MIEIAQLAQETMAVLTPLLPLAKELAAKAGDGAATEAGKALLGWLSSAFQGKSTKLERSIEKPEDKTRQNALEAEIVEMAETDESFRTQLAELVRAAKESGPVVTQQIANVIGNNNKLAQARGKDISIHIG